MVENLCTHYGRRVCGQIKSEGAATAKREGIKKEPQSYKNRQRRRKNDARDESDVAKSEQISEGDFYAFPTVAALAEDPTKVEAKLRGLGFGYRAAYIAQSASQIHAKGGEEYLETLRSMSYEEARKELLLVKGIGPKVRTKNSL